MRTGILPAPAGGIDGLKKKATEHTELTAIRKKMEIPIPLNYQGLYRVFNCGSIEEYAIKYCDLSKPLLYRLIRLADGLERHPLVRDAFESGLISRADPSDSEDCR